MNLTKFFTGIVIVFAAAFGSLAAYAAPQCSSPSQVVVPYASGNLAMDYRQCVDGTANYMTGTVNYNNLSFDGNFTINGSMQIQMNITGYSIGSIVLNGGPLLFSIGGVLYTVNLNALTFGFDSAFRPISASGSLVINGTVVQASPELWSYLFR